MSASEGKNTATSRVDEARQKRDSLRAQLHHDLYNRLQSLESEQATLEATLRNDTAPTRGKTEAKIQELHKKINAARDEFVAHANTTVAEIDDEIATLESSAQARSAGSREKAEQSLNELKAGRNKLREKTAALRDAAGDRLKKASAEFNDVMAELTEKRNQGWVGIN